MATQPVTRVHDCFVAICIIAFCVLLGSFVAVMVCENPELAFYLFGTREKLKVLEFLGVGMGGVLLAIGAVIANRRAKAMEVAAQEQAKANLNTEQGQRQERLKNAIEHLGHQSDSVRLGGAYELFHLARDTEELRQTVLDILCSHIRRVTGEGEYRATHKSKPSEEIQSLLTLLFVQNYEVFKGLDVNLRGSWLTGADLWAARLVGARLSDVHLQRTFLRDVRLQGAFLRDACLQGADLHKARLQGTILHSAKLQAAEMQEACLQGASLGYAGLQSAKLEGADLRGARDFANRPKSSRAILPTFKELITESIDKPSVLSEVTFEGGLSQKEVEALVEGLSDENANWLRMRLKSHIDQAARRHLPPETSGAITGTYTEEEAETWIAECEADM